MNILFTGTWGPPFLVAARSYRQQRIGVYFLDIGGSGEWRSYSSCVDGARPLPRECVGTPEGLNAIRQYAREVGASALLALSDRHLLWLAQNRNDFEPSCRLLMPEFNVLSSLMSKRYQIEVASHTGLDVLPTYYLWNEKDIAAVPEAAYPLALRPDQETMIRPFFKVRLAQTPAQLSEIVRALEVVQAPIIAQPFLNLPNLVVHGVASESGTILALKPFLVPRKFEGVTLSIIPSCFPPALEQHCRDFIRKTKITGCFHFDFLLSPHDDRCHFLEVNVRMGGTTDKVMQVGFDEPLMVLGAYGLLESPLHSAPALRPRLVVSRRSLVKHIVWALKGNLTPLDYPPVSRLKHLAYSCRDILLAKDSVFDWHDLRGSLWYYLR